MNHLLTWFVNKFQTVIISSVIAEIKCQSQQHKFCRIYFTHSHSVCPVVAWLFPKKYVMEEPFCLMMEKKQRASNGLGTR